ncbi:uncharacterized protein DSM5745_06942 [Aspergillus mulundensis]|uniref:Uncharacterized protein n=1 Tax=Aspergillus mulundensis TaxID=1810919 RepID=A0A3D8RJY3_9EURO|nr:hypothetical protein DSM5745_06942 [Aspergillus mulundensis]RDW74280.1 hypothetical protein DSM5745_06942 [Aspergillus mulundensis]
MQKLSLTSHDPDGSQSSEDGTIAASTGSAPSQSTPSLTVTNVSRSPFSKGWGVPRPSAVLRKQVKSARRHNQRLSENRKALRRERDYLAGDLSDAEAEILRLKAQINDMLKVDEAKTLRLAKLNEQISDSRLSLQGARAENDRLQERARIAQAAALRATETGRPVPMEDREVRDKLETLEEKLKGWARCYAVDDLAALNQVSDEKMNRVIYRLSGYCLQEEWSELKSRFPTLKNKLPYMLSQALLAKTIFERIFNNPFFIFPDSQHYHNLPGRENMGVLYDRLYERDEPGSHKWRSHTLLMLNNGKGHQTSNYVDTALDNFSRSLENQILSGPIQVLLKPVSGQIHADKRADSLRGIIRTAGELAFRLWTQHVYPTCHSLGKACKFFSVDSGMHAHRLHRLEDDDPRLDGHRVAIITQPLILAWGDENAENYENSKVWAKAVVCVDELGVKTEKDVHGRPWGAGCQIEVG